MNRKARNIIGVWALAVVVAALSFWPAAILIGIGGIVVMVVVFPELPWDDD